MHTLKNNDEFENPGLLTELAENRAKIYWFLAEFYNVKPTKELLKELHQRIQKLRYDDELGEDFAKLEDFLRRFDYNDILNLQVHFTKLFRGVKRGYGPPPPYESLYRGENSVFGEWTLRVMAFFHDCGFGIIDDSVGPPDHITSELKFMSMLCIKENESRKQNDSSYLQWMEKELRFLDEHIFQWVPHYCSLIEQENDGFYSIIARITRKWIESDFDFLKLMLST